MITYFATLSSAVTLRPDGVDYPMRTHGTALANEPFALQLAMRSDDARFCPVSVQVTGELPLRAYREEYIPMTQTMADTPGGMYPDPLSERAAAPVIDEIENGNPWTGAFFREHDKKTTVNVSRAYTTALWIDCNPTGETIPAGEYPLTIRVVSLENGAELCRTVFTLTIYDALLPAHTAYYTNWFHCDCLADTYGIPVYSERFWEIFARWVKNAAENGMTTLLLPAFTPAFDTPVTTERMDVQLCDITEADGAWRFDFTRLERYVDIALSCGIRYFEHAPFFSQWGAAHAPNIYADGRLRFGWDTDAGGAEYGAFLRAYLTAFFSFADKKGIRDKMVYHISDEPSEAQLPAYRRSLEQVRELLRGEIVIDALDKVAFYRDGIVQTPVCEIRMAEKFADAVWADGIPRHSEMGGKQFWLYYTGGPNGKMPNRGLTQAYWKIRELGLMLYRYGANGFLHWGYNFYYDRMSQGLFSPLVNPCGYKQMPGPSYLVYPAADGGVLPSIREKQMRAAFCDLRALWLAEEQYGRAAVMAFTERMLGTVDVAMDMTAEALWDWRDALNAWIDNDKQ